MPRIVILLVAFTLVAFIAPVHSAAAVETWPGEAWPRAPHAAAPDALKALEDYAFAPLDAEGQGIKTHGLVVIRDGALIYERYAQGFAAQTPHLLWSVSKSVLHALYGRALQLGALDSLDQPVAPSYPPLDQTDHGAITYRHLLTMTSGIAFNEGYEFNPFASSVIAMLYTRGRNDMAAFAATHPRSAAPGDEWSYKSGDSLILSAALESVLGPARYAEFPWSALFEPLGMANVTWETDRSGRFVTSSYLYATPRDAARLGWLYATDGVWQGERLLPTGYARAAGVPSAAYVEALDGVFGGFLSQIRYGLHWWSNYPAQDGAQAANPDLPADLLIASGHWGQRLYVIPSARMVIVRVGRDKGARWRNGTFVPLALAAFGTP